jgi:hypothetical protein
MTKPKDTDEVALANLSKRLLAMPHKLRSESKIGKQKTKGSPRGPKARAPSSSSKNAEPSG